MPKRVTPAERVERLRKRYGSHDKLATAIRLRAAELGMTKKPTRQTVIRWEGGARISEGYAALLADLSQGTAEHFRPNVERSVSPGRQVTELVAGLARLEARVALIEKLVDVPPGQDEPRANANG